MKKMKIIIMATVGIIGFVGTFAARFFVMKANMAAVVPVAAAMTGTEQDTTDYSDGGSYGLDMEPRVIPTASGTLTRSMSEKQLKSLIFDIRSEMKLHLKKKRQLKEEEERIQLARESLLQDVDELSRLREELASAISYLKERQGSLERTMIEVDAAQKANMLKIAKRYDSMATKDASNIMITMNKNKQLDDVVFIIYYMKEKNSAKLLAEISKTEALLASVLTTRLKSIKESG